MRCGWIARSAAMVVVGIVTSLPAFAAGPSAASAQALFNEGKRLVEVKDFAAACPKFSASQKLDPGAGTLLHLGSCYESLGKTASAWATYVEAGAAARARNRQDWADNANKRAERLEPLLAKVKLSLKAPTPSLEVLHDAITLDLGVVGTALPVDPGIHTFEAHAKGYKSWSTSVDVKERRVVEVEIPALEPTVQIAPVSPTSPDVSKASAPEGLRLNTAEESSANPLRTAGFITLGVGAVALAAGAVTGIMAVQNDSRSKDLCPGLRCSNSEGVDAASQARTFGTVSTLALIGGGVLAAGGLLMVLVGKPSTTEHGRLPIPKQALLRLSGAPSADGFWTSISGAF